jgi:hypothetical protein
VLGGLARGPRQGVPIGQACFFAVCRHDYEGWGVQAENGKAEDPAGSAKENYQLESVTTAKGLPKLSWRSKSRSMAARTG